MDEHEFWVRFCEKLDDREPALVAELTGHFREPLVAFRQELHDYFQAISKAPLPDSWRADLDRFLNLPRGVIMRPPQQRFCAWLVECDAREYGRLPGGPVPGYAEWRRQLGPAGLQVNYNTTAMPKAEPPKTPPATAPRTLAADKSPGLSPFWPALSEADRERNRARVGVSSWWPLQPVSSLDSAWELQFVALGRESRKRLLAVFQELATLGRLTQEAGDAEIPNLTSLEIGQLRVQQAYDAYLQSLIKLRGWWNKYLHAHWILGIHVVALMDRIDEGLPAHIADLKSTYDAPLKAALQESKVAGRDAVSRIEGSYRVLQVIDVAITVIEVASVVGSIKAGAQNAFVKAVAEGMTRNAARNAAIKFAVRQVAINAAVAYGSAKLVPPVLSAAGLRDDEIRAGLLVLQIIQSLVATRAAMDGPATRVPFKPNGAATKNPGVFIPFAGPSGTSGKGPLKPSKTPLNGTDLAAPPKRTSVWDEGPGLRGEAIEKRLGQNLPRTFPIIDKFDFVSGMATSIKSIDLRAPTYANPEAIVRKVQGYIDLVAGFHREMQAGVEIKPSQIKGRALDLAIPPGATQQQQQALQGVVEYGKTKGVVVNIVEVF